MSRNKPASRTRTAKPPSVSRPAHSLPATPAPHHRTPSGEALFFGHDPFAAGHAPRYYGTGVAGYTTGPGFTGGYYGFGDEAPEIPTELEREYLEDVYGTEWQMGAEAPQPSVAVLPRRVHTRPVRRYPPGPKGYRRSDERIREDLCERLMRARHIDSSEVSVEVTDGKVVLEGTVPQRRMKHAIEDMADACLGVHDIENRIQVTPASAAG